MTALVLLVASFVVFGLATFNIPAQNPPKFNMIALGLALLTASMLAGQVLK